MTFARPEFLALIPLVLGILILAWLAREKRMARLVHAFGDNAISRLLPPVSYRLQRVRAGMPLTAALLVCLAAAGPAEVRDSSGGAVVSLDIAIVVDTSISMSAADADPSRIGRAGEVVADIAAGVPQARFSLSLLGDWPYAVVPATDDPELLSYFSRSLDEELVAEFASSIRTANGDRGAPLQDAISYARDELATLSGEDRVQVILIVSDGAVTGDSEDILAAASAVSEEGIAIWTAGVGTTPGATLQIGEGRDLDASGNLLTGGYDEELLRAIAAAGGGGYENVSTQNGARALVSDLRSLAGIAGPDDFLPQRVTFWLLVLALALILLDCAFEGRSLRVPGWLGKRTA